MPELRSKIPKRIGVLLSSETHWETIFNYYYIEKNGFMRLPIVLWPEKTDKEIIGVRKKIHKDLAAIEIIDTEDVKTGSLKALLVSVGKTEFNELCNFEEKSEAFGIDLKLRAFLRTVYRKGLPIGAYGYGVPLLVKAVQGISKTGPIVTVGNNPKLQAGIEAAGAQAIATRPTEVIIDHTNKFVTSGGQLASKRLTEVSEDCENMFKAILELIKE